jgi:hypothetical protein
VVAEPAAEELVVDRDQRPRRVPVLGQHHRAPPLCPVGGDDVGEVAGEPDAHVLDLALLGLVDAVTRLGGDRLAPSVQGDAVDGLDPGSVRVADEVQVDTVAAARQRASEMGDPNAEAAGAGVPIGTLEREVDEADAVARG